uniref:PB2 n=1 Tax=Goettingen orthomyxo-like virus TaxID=2789610 RepID=A0A7S8ZXI4_9ORTO|nr:PB2 [Goettingen orthomyxo-like virus]
MKQTKSISDLKSVKSSLFPDFASQILFPMSSMSYNKLNDNITNFIEEEKKNLEGSRMSIEQHKRKLESKYIPRIKWVPTIKDPPPVIVQNIHWTESNYYMLNANFKEERDDERLRRICSMLLDKCYLNCRNQLVEMIKCSTYLGAPLVEQLSESLSDFGTIIMCKAVMGLKIPRSHGFRHGQYKFLSGKSTAFVHFFIHPINKADTFTFHKYYGEQEMIGKRAFR